MNYYSDIEKNIVKWYYLIGFRNLYSKGAKDMPKIYDFDELANLTRPIFKRYGVSRAYIFGSYARGEANENSDIDLRIDSGKIKSLFVLGGLYNDLTDILNKPIDLITTNSLEHAANAERTEKFRLNIRKDERLIYEENN